MANARGQRGMSGSVQVAVLLPAAFALLMLLLQWSLLMWAEATALASAQQGAAVAAAIGGTDAEGKREALEAAANGALDGVDATVTTSGTSVTATVSGRPVTLLWAAEVTRSVTVPAERLTGS